MDQRCHVGESTKVIARQFRITRSRVRQILDRDARGRADAQRATWLAEEFRMADGCGTNSLANLTENRLAAGECRQGVFAGDTMGKITKALRREFENAQRRKSVPFSALAQAARTAESTPDYQQLVRQGHDPLHAVYTTTINLASTFLEFAADLPPFQDVSEFIADEQDLYMPGYPPMSPITVSLFTTWTLFDFSFGPDQETVGDCFAGLSDLLELGAVREQALDQLRRSRLGLYELTASGGNRVRLREVVTNAELEALIPTGFRGEVGQYMLVRLLPPLNGETPYHVAVTTPYITLGIEEQDWLGYFARQQVVPGTLGMEERLHRHLKFGRRPDYWAEYIFYGYVNYRSDAILLTGLPDQPTTQPQHKSFDPRTAKIRLSE